MKTMYSIVVGSDFTALESGHGTLEAAQKEMVFIRKNVPGFIECALYMVMSEDLYHVADYHYIGNRLVEGDVFSTKAGFQYNYIRVI